MLKTKQKIALAGIAQSFVMGARRLMGRGPTTTVHRGSFVWDIDLREGIDFSIWLLGAFEPETVRCYRRLVKPGNVVLDIGANIGAHTLPLAQAVGPGGRVVAFEPTDYAFAKLSRNVQLNPALATRVTAVQCMLVDGDAQGRSTPGLYSSWPLSVSDDLHALHQGRRMSTDGAQARTLDSVVAELGLARVDCVKLDIDGFECGMLRGAREVLTRWRPPIVMELAPYALAEQGESVEALIGLLAEYRYTLSDLTLRQSIAMDAAGLARRIPAGASMNVLARAAPTPA